MKQPQIYEGSMDRKLRTPVLANCVELYERITTLSLYCGQMRLISYAIYPHDGPSKK